MEDQAFDPVLVEMMRGCHCATPGARTRTSGAWGLGILAIAALLRRKKRN